MMMNDEDDEGWGEDAWFPGEEGGEEEAHEEDGEVELRLEDLVQADLSVAKSVKRFADSADCLFFGHGHELAHQDALQLVSQLRVRTIMSLNHKTVQ